MVDTEAATCRTTGDAPEIDGNLFIDEGHQALKPGDILTVEVDEAADYDLWGSIRRSTAVSARRRSRGRFANASLASAGPLCPTPSSVARVAPGMQPAIASAAMLHIFSVSAPAIISVGTSIAASSSQPSGAGRAD